jgi:hypothetical protein
MARAFTEIAFTPAVRAFQARMGSRRNDAALDHAETRGDALGAPEVEFITARDGFYQASVGEGGWPYVQFRGGPTGFLKVLDARTIGYADFRGNVQYISAGNIQADGRVALILMDYAEQRRLKIWGRARLVDEAQDPALIARLEDPAYRARVERAVIIQVEAIDWNCPQHITPRYTEAEIAQRIAPLQAELACLRARPVAEAAAGGEVLGKGPLDLVISGIRQLAPRVRAYELRAPDGADLPRVAAGAHLDLPVRLPSGRVETRRYSISSNPARRDAYEIAVLREQTGSGGSAALHDGYRLGLRLGCALPGNDFALHVEARPAVLIAGGIGITPIKAMALQLQSEGRAFRLHYAGRARREMAYLDRLERAFGPLLSTYDAAAGERLDVRAVIADAAPDALFYVCGPARLIAAVHAAAADLGIDPSRVRFERFQAAPRADDRPVSVELRRSRRTIAVPAERSILDAVHAAGIDAPAACRSGVCGSCAVEVLAGAPDHRDAALDQAQRERGALMCICVSRAITPTLVLDL